MPAPDSYPAGIDPAHVWAIATTAAPSIKQDGSMLLAGGRFPARIALPDRFAALEADAALRLVGYQVGWASGGARGRDLLVTGWSNQGLQQRLTAMREVLRKLAAVPDVTAFVALELGRLPAAMLPSQIDQRLAVERAGLRLRTWISRTSGVHAPRDPRALPAEPRCAFRVAATLRAEEAIDTLAQRHLQLAELAVTFYPQLRHRLGHAAARESAIRYAGLAILHSQQQDQPASPVQGSNPALRDSPVAPAPDPNPGAGPSAKPRPVSDFPAGNPISPTAQPPSIRGATSPRGRIFPSGRAGRRPPH
jgi:hypothetical protein